VLGVRGIGGEEAVAQPLRSVDGSVLLWNGEVFDGLEGFASGNDTEAVLAALCCQKSSIGVIQLLERCAGPWALIFWHAGLGELFFARDRLGRRSLMIDLDELLSSPTLSLRLSSTVPTTLLLPPSTGQQPRSTLEEKLSGGAATSAETSQLLPAPTGGGGELVESQAAESIAGADTGDCVARLCEDGAPLGGELIPEDGTAKSTEPRETPLADRSTDEEQSHATARWHDLPVSVLLSLRFVDSGSATGEQIHPSWCVYPRTPFTVTPYLEYSSLSLSAIHSLITDEASLNSFLPFGVRSLQGNLTASAVQLPSLIPRSYASATLCALLRQAVRRRLVDIPDPPCPRGQTSLTAFTSPTRRCARVSVLFSGGIDSTILARLVDVELSDDQPIDLVNVAFGQTPFTVPDRKTGLASLAELRRLSPMREFRFVQVNVTWAEMERHRAYIYSLLHPSTTVMDLTIGCALWFAARGEGLLEQDGSAFLSSARVLLLGNGADELCGGYSRHRGVFLRQENVGLAAELQTDIQRMWKRNLGRDDRIIASLAKEARHPFLDEHVCQFVHELPLEEVCDLSLPKGVGDKRILRQVAAELGLSSASALPKRAIQFGSRVSKAFPNEGTQKMSQ